MISHIIVSLLSGGLVYLLTRKVLDNSRPVFYTRNRYGGEQNQLGAELFIYYEDRSYIALGTKENGWSWYRIAKFEETVLNPSLTKSEMLSILKHKNNEYWYDTHTSSNRGYPDMYYMNHRNGTVINKDLYNNIRVENNQL